MDKDGKETCSSLQLEHQSSQKKAGIILSFLRTSVDQNTAPTEIKGNGDCKPTTITQQDAPELPHNLKIVDKSYEEETSMTQIHTLVTCSSLDFSQAFPKEDGTENNELELCRICDCEGDDDNPLLTPCRCTGTVRFVHQLCLQKWIKTSNIRCCELCKYTFIMETKVKPLYKWEKFNITRNEWKKIIKTIAVYIVALTCVTWSLQILIDRTTDMIYVSNGIFSWTLWMKIVIAPPSLILSIVILYAERKFYINLWKRLKAHNSMILVQNCPETKTEVEEQQSSCNHCDSSEVPTLILNKSTNFMKGEDMVPEVTLV
ncbi:E3 ubiquitin-protein ligase MARCHF8-like [Erpetoichthys calabaricus]|uniref:E3 ubiquitin-protein ligase MARCHF8-like n=1 Tax=Erpetoichthys calabaricus TaxID=27687 RepID=UPI002233F4F4|nr:E3 ubiquitin-protein ligase MARCHF8-like [Erpetoichthys calabaricus]